MAFVFRLILRHREHFMNSRCLIGLQFIQNLFIQFQVSSGINLACQFAVKLYLQRIANYNIQSEYEELIIIFLMIASHFFPRNYLPRRTIAVCDRRSSLGIHSLVQSKQKQRHSKLADKSQTLSLSQVQARQHSLNLKYNHNQEEGKLLEIIQPRDQNDKLRLNPRKKSLFVKGFCKKPSLQLKINPYNGEGVREIISQNCRRLKKDQNQAKVRMGTTNHVDLNRKQFKLTKRKSKDTCVFRGWEINYDDFNDF